MQMFLVYRNENEFCLAELQLFPSSTPQTLQLEASSFASVNEFLSAFLSACVCVCSVDTPLNWVLMPYKFLINSWLSKIFDMYLLYICLSHDFILYEK